MTIRYTPQHSLPYPEGSDTVAPASRDFQSLAFATDVALTTVGTARLQQMADGTPLSTLDNPGTYAASSWVGGPPDTGAGYVEVRTLVAATSVLQRFQDHGTGRVFFRTRGTTGWTQWTRIDGMAEQRIAHALTRPLASLTETTTSRSVRIPFAVPVRARQWRVVIRNVNYRTNTVYPGAVTLRTLNVGHGTRDTNGDLTSSFLAGGQRRILARDVAVSNLGAGYQSPWVYDELRPGVDYLLSFGYEHAGITTHRGMAGGWQTSGNPMNAELTDDPTAAKLTRLPFDVSIEYLTQDDIPADVVLGDSIAAASDATFPVHEAPLAIADRTTGRATRLYAFGGAAFGEWIGPNWGDPASVKWQHVTNDGRADRAFIALGNNDIHAGTDLTTLKANFRALLALVRERVSSNVVACTVTPRTAWTGTANDSLRRAFNDWLRTYPEGIAGVADTARAVETVAGDAPRAEFVTGDGIHFNTAGSTALAAALGTGALEAALSGIGTSVTVTDNGDGSATIDTGV